jgi:hypothetical protein
LGSDKIEARLGGIYTLERISRESPGDYWTVMETLCAFVRERAPWKAPEGASSETVARLYEKAQTTERRISPPTDIEAVLTVIVRREGLDQGWLNFRETDLRGANLGGANLSNADLSGANLRGVHLVMTNLSEANLNGADLSGAHLTLANLRSADFRGANLSGVDLLEEQFAQTITLDPGVDPCAAAGFVACRNRSA